MSGVAIMRAGERLTVGDPVYSRPGCGNLVVYRSGLGMVGYALNTADINESVDVRRPAAKVRVPPEMADALAYSHKVTVDARETRKTDTRPVAGFQKRRQQVLIVTGNN